MLKAQCAGVKRLARTGLETVGDKGVVGRGALAAQSLVAAIAGVVEQRVADVAHVHAYLVSAPRLKYTAHNADMSQRFDYSIMCDGALADGSVGGIDVHLQAVAHRAGDVALDSALGRFGLSPHHRHVLAPRGLVEELTSEMRLCVRGLGHDEQSRRVLVDAVHQTEARVRDVIVGSVAEMPCQGVHQRARPVAVTGMYNQSGRLVDNQHVVVLVNDVERDVLGHHLVLVARAVHHHLHHVEGLYAVVRFHRLAVNQYAARLGSLLHAVARRSGQPLGQKLVDAQQLLALVGDKAEMLVQAVTRAVTGVDVLGVNTVGIEAVKLVIDKVVGSHIAHCQLIESGFAVIPETSEGSEAKIESTCSSM